MTKNGRPVLALEIGDQLRRVWPRACRRADQSRPTEDAGEKLRQRFGDLAELGEDEHLLLPLGNLLAQLRQPLELAAASRGS